MPTVATSVASVLKKTRSTSVGVNAILNPAVITRNQTVAVSARLMKVGTPTVGISATIIRTVTTSTKTPSFDAHLTKAGAQVNIAISAELVSTPGTVTQSFGLFRARKSRR